jgi:hypothetical protein
MTWQGEKFKGKLGFTMAESKPSWRTPPRPPEGSPNVIMIVLMNLRLKPTSKGIVQD